MFSNIPRSYWLLTPLGALVTGTLAAWFPLVAALVVSLGIIWLLFRDSRAILYAALVTVVLGQFGRIPPGAANGAVLLIDVCMGFLFGIWIFWLVASKRALIRDRYQLTFLGLLAVGLVYLVVNPFDLSITETITNGFYWLRLLFYGSLVWIVPDLFQNKQDAQNIFSWLIKVGMAVVIVGFLQLYLLPDIRIFTSFGWDPHVGRMVSSFLDPNYLGGFLAILLALLLVSLQSGKSNILIWLAVATTLIATVLTFSRSGYLAVGLVLLIFGVRYSWRLMLLAIICITPLALTIPRVQERVIGGFSVDKTAQLRIESWTNALTIAEGYYPNGVGYNNYQSAQEEVGTIEPGATSRATAGTDSSLLNVLVTTGILGITAFYLFWILIVRKCQELIKNNPETSQGRMALALMILIVPLSVHALFVNAWFYPFIMIYLCLMTGVLFIPLKKPSVAA